MGDLTFTDEGELKVTAPNVPTVDKLWEEITTQYNHWQGQPRKTTERNSRIHQYDELKIAFGSQKEDGTWSMDGFMSVETIKGFLCEFVGEKLLSITANMISTLYGPSSANTTPLRFAIFHLDSNHWLPLYYDEKENRIVLVESIPSYFAKMQANYEAAMEVFRSRLGKSAQAAEFVTMMGAKQGRNNCALHTIANIVAVAKGKQFTSLSIDHAVLFRRYLIDLHLKRVNKGSYGCKKLDRTIRKTDEFVTLSDTENDEKDKEKEDTGDNWHNPIVLDDTEDEEDEDTGESHDTEDDEEDEDTGESHDKPDDTNEDEAHPAKPVVIVVVPKHTKDDNGKETKEEENERVDQGSSSINSSLNQQAYEKICETYVQDRKIKSGERIKVLIEELTSSNKPLSTSKKLAFEELYGCLETGRVRLHRYVIPGLVSGLFRQSIIIGANKNGELEFEAVKYADTPFRFAVIEILIGHTVVMEFEGRMCSHIQCFSKSAICSEWSDRYASVLKKIKEENFIPELDLEHKYRHRGPETDEQQTDPWYEQNPAYTASRALVWLWKRISSPKELPVVDLSVCRFAHLFRAQQILNHERAPFGFELWEPGNNKSEAVDWENLNIDDELNKRKEKVDDHHHDKYSALKQLQTNKVVDDDAILGILGGHLRKNVLVGSRDRNSKLQWRAVNHDHASFHCAVVELNEGYHVPFLFENGEEEVFAKIRRTHKEIRLEEKEINSILDDMRDQFPLTDQSKQFTWKNYKSKSDDFQKRKEFTRVISVFWLWREMSVETVPKLELTKHMSRFLLLVRADQILANKEPPFGFQYWQRVQKKTRTEKGSRSKKPKLVMNGERLTVEGDLSKSSDLIQRSKQLRKKYNANPSKSEQLGLIKIVGGGLSESNMIGYLLANGIKTVVVIDSHYRAKVFKVFGKQTVQAKYALFQLDGYHWVPIFKREEAVIELIDSRQLNDRHHTYQRAMEAFANYLDNDREWKYKISQGAQEEPPELSPEVLADDRRYFDSGYFAITNIIIHDLTGKISPSLKPDTTKIRTHIAQVRMDQIEKFKRPPYGFSKISRETETLMEKYYSEGLGELHPPTRAELLEIFKKRIDALEFKNKEKFDAWVWVRAYLDLGELDGSTILGFLSAFTGRRSVFVTKLLEDTEWTILDNEDEGDVVYGVLKLADAKYFGLFVHGGKITCLGVGPEIPELKKAKDILQRKHLLRGDWEYKTIVPVPKYIPSVQIIEAVLHQRPASRTWTPPQPSAHPMPRTIKPLFEHILLMRWDQIDHDSRRYVFRTIVVDEEGKDVANEDRETTKAPKKKKNTARERTILKQARKRLQERRIARCDGVQRKPKSPKPTKNQNEFKPKAVQPKTKTAAKIKILKPEKNKTDAFVYKEDHDKCEEKLHTKEINSAAIMKRYYQLRKSLANKQKLSDEERKFLKVLFPDDHERAEYRVGLSKELNKIIKEMKKLHSTGLLERLDKPEVIIGRCKPSLKELRGYMERNKLPVSGTKAELVARMNAINERYYFDRYQVCQTLQNSKK